MGWTDSGPLSSITKAVKALTVEPYLFFCLLGYNVKFVSFQDFLIDKGCRNIHDFGNDICDHLDSHEAEKMQSIATGNDLFLGVMLLDSLPAMIVAIFLGPWSDKHSRKYPMVIAACGMLLESLMCTILMAFPNQSPYLFVAAALFDGVCGGYIICTSAAYSYLSDVTDERSRPSRFAILEFFFLAAIVTGNITGGQLYDPNNPNYIPVMIISACSFACALLYIVFFVKESKPPVPAEKRGEMLRDLVSLDNIKQSYITCSRKRPGNIRLQIWLLVWISCCQRFIEMGTLSVGFSFTKGMYEWNVTQFSNATVILSVINATVTVVVIPILCNKYRLHEAALGLVGVLSLMAKMILTSVAIIPGLFFYAWICGALESGIGIALRSRLSKLVNKEELGRAFSLMGTFQSVTPLVGSAVFLQLYNSSTDIFLGMPFAVSGVFLLPCAVMFAWMMNMPTISLGEFARNEEQKSEPLKNLSTNYDRLKEEKC